MQKYSVGCSAGRAAAQIAHQDFACCIYTGKPGKRSRSDHHSSGCGAPGKDCHPPCEGGVLPHRGVLLSTHGGQHRPVRMAALQGTRRCPLLGKFWRGSGEHQAKLSAHLRKAGCPRYGRYRCCHRHAGFPALEPAFDLDRLCGLPSKGSGTPAHRGDLDTVGGRFMFIFRVQRRA